MNNLNIKKKFNIEDFINIDKYNDKPELKKKIIKLFSILSETLFNSHKEKYFDDLTTVETHNNNSTTISQKIISNDIDLNQLLYKKVLEDIKTQLSLLDPSQDDINVKFDRLVDNQQKQYDRLKKTEISKTEFLYVDLHGDFIYDNENKENLQYKVSTVPENCVLILLTPINKYALCDQERRNETIKQIYEDKNFIKQNLFCLNKNNNNTQYFIKSKNLYDNALVLYPGQQYIDMITKNEKGKNLGVYTVEGKKISFFETKKIVKHLFNDYKNIDLQINRNLSELLNKISEKNKDKINYIHFGACRYFDVENKITRDIYLYELFMNCFNLVLSCNKLIDYNKNIYIYGKNTKVQTNNINKQKELIFKYYYDYIISYIKSIDKSLIKNLKEELPISKLNKIILNKTKEEIFLTPIELIKYLTILLDLDTSDLNYENLHKIIQNLIIILNNGVNNLEKNFISKSNQNYLLLFIVKLTQKFYNNEDLILKSKQIETELNKFPDIVIYFNKNFKDFMNLIKIINKKDDTLQILSTFNSNIDIIKLAIMCEIVGLKDFFNKEVSRSIKLTNNKLNNKKKTKYGTNARKYILHQFQHYKNNNNNKTRKNNKNRIQGESVA